MLLGRTFNLILLQQCPLCKSLNFILLLQGLLQFEFYFVLDEDASKSASFMWRVAYRYERWTMPADLALRLISCGMSVAGAGRVLLMQKNITGFHRIRFGMRTMEMRLKSGRPFPIRREEDP
jgi:hypothetical protein